MEPKKSSPRIYDAASGRIQSLEKMIRRLGIAAVAERYGVSASAVRKWLNRSRRPAVRTVIRPQQKLF